MSFVFRLSSATILCIFTVIVGMTAFTGCTGGGGGAESWVAPVAGGFQGKITFAPPAGNARFAVSAGASVSSADVWLEERPDIRTKTDANGNFVLLGVPTGTPFYIIACFTDEVTGVAYMQRHGPFTVESENSQEDVGEISLEEAKQSISGTVKDIYGNPIFYAAVTVWGITERTDASGKFSTPPLPESVSEMNVSIVANGFNSLFAALPLFTRDLPPEFEWFLSPVGDVRQTPVIAFLPASDTVSPDSAIEVEIKFDNSQVSAAERPEFSWSTTAGTLTVAPDEMSAVWNVPSEPGLATISVSAEGNTWLPSVIHLSYAIGGSYEVVPRVNSFSPQSAAPGQVVSIFGSGFGKLDYNRKVFFGMLEAQIQDWGEDFINVIVPVDAESASLTVKIGTDEYPVGNFTLIDFVTTREPAYGPPGALVILKGFGFGDLQGENTVTLRGDVLPVVKWTNTEIHVQILRTSRSGSMGVVMRGRYHQAGDFSVSEITGITPDRSMWKTDGFPSSVSITGSGFGDDQNDNYITFTPEIAANVESWSDEEIIVSVPETAKSGELTLFINGSYLRTQTLTLTYANEYLYDFSWSGPRYDSSPFLPGLAFDSGGNMYVTDFDNFWVWKFDDSNQFVTRIGTPGSENGQFVTPWGVAVDGNGDLYVSDTGNSRIQKLDGDGNFIAVVGEKGVADGQFDNPLGLAFDSDDNLLVADYGNNRIQKFSSELAFILTWGTTGRNDGEFDSPAGLAVASSGLIYVADSGNHRIQEFDSSGVFRRWYGLDDMGNTGWKQPGSGRTGSTGDGAGAFNEPYGVWVTDDGRLFVADTENGRIQQISTLDGNATIIGEKGRGLGQYTGPVSIGLKGDDVYVADSENSRVQIVTPSEEFKEVVVPDSNQLNTYFTRLAIDRNGEMINALDRDDGTIAVFDFYGEFIKRIGSRGSGNGQLLDPDGLAVSADGEVWVADTGNARIQKFDSEGRSVLTFGAFGTGDGQFKSPKRIAIDGSGNLLISDFANNRIQAFSATGDFLFSFGRYGRGNGEFDGPMGIAVNSGGEIYVADSGNARVQKFDSTGKFLGWWGADETDNAGWHGSSTSNTGKQSSGPGRFDIPIDLVVDGEGCVFVSDYFNHIQKFGPDQSEGSFGNYIAEVISSNRFIGLDLDAAGCLYVTDAAQQISRYTPTLN